jgi:hypothetical protein
MLHQTLLSPLQQELKEIIITLLLMEQVHKFQVKINNQQLTVLKFKKIKLEVYQTKIRSVIKMLITITKLVKVLL